MGLKIEKPPHLPGEIIQVVNTQRGGVATGVTVLPQDNTIPQNNEGDQYMSLGVTPLHATNYLMIDVVVNLAHGSNHDTMAAALFQDDVVDALAAMQGACNANAHSPCLITFRHFMIAGTTSLTTFKVRAGCDVAGTTTFNGQNAGEIFDGRMVSSITIMEVKR